MNCHRHEEGLLLLAHGAANPLQRWLLRRHLSACPACQDRFRQLQRTSRALADGIRRSADLPAWRLPATTALAALPQRRTPVLLATAAAATGLTAAGYQAYRMAFPPEPIACKAPIVATPPPYASVRHRAPSPAPAGRRRLSRVVP